MASNPRDQVTLSLGTVYSTGSLCVVFGDSQTPAGNLAGFETIVEIPTDIIAKSCSIRTNVSGNCTISVSSAATAGSVFVAISSGEALSAGTDYSNLTLGAWAITTLPAGMQMKILVVSAATSKQVQFNLKYWRKLW